VYDEFGAILVLIMAFVYRYGFTSTDIGIGHESFVARLIERSNHSINPDDLTEDQSKHLASWLKGLYDSGNEGLSNDVFASCRPQDFYLIVPTFFSQTVMACSAGILSYETVKGGLECTFSSTFCPICSTDNTCRSWRDVLATLVNRGIELDDKPRP
jgi:mediator of RNA polymerase II transcription subunit 5